MTLDRYLARQLALPFLVGVFLLTAVFTAFAASAVLADAAAGSLSPSVLWQLILLQCVTAAEVIVPSALFFSILFVFERLNRDRELVAMTGGGLSPLRLLWPVAWYALAALVLVGVLSLQARPWAYRTIYVVKDLAARPDVASMRAGRFYPLGPDLVVTAAGVRAATRVLEDVFARQEQADGVRLIRAREAYLAPPDDAGSQVVAFRHGQALTLSGVPGVGDRRHRFEELRYRWQLGAVIGNASNRRARPTNDLFGSRVPRDIAELQWRFTLPMMTFGMTLVAGGLGSLAPGTVTALRTLGAIATYVLVFYVAAAAHTSLESGGLPPMPGILWLPILPVLVLGIIRLVARMRT
ncbi:MAG: LptF/LptG family permease [Pseudomonadales bacterium]|nr:LptF/LptG family permease [Pseudomonadales bacterium]